MNFRYARHTDDLESLVKFYTEIVGLKQLGEFKNHSSYDGVFLGVPESNWHIEFTQSNETAKHKPDDDDLLVFYIKTEKELDVISEKINKAGIQIVKSKNPFWNENGFEIKDPDGFSIVFSKMKMKTN